MKNLLAAHPPWRQLLIISVALPLVITLAVLAFAWPAGRTAPRDLPVGIVGASAASQHAAAGLTHGRPGAFDLHLYPDTASARSAIENRDVYGAFVVSPTEITVLEASAAGPAVSQLLGTVGQQLGDHASPKAAVKTIDVVPLAADDPRGTVFSSALLPLTICGILITAAIALLLGFRPAWRQLTALPLVSAVAALGVFVVAQSFLGALPQQHLATWAALSLTLLAISATTAGLIAVVGRVGIGIGAALMVFVGNPFSGATSAPEMLPRGVDHIGQWLPPGAGASLLRSTAYFDGHGAADHLVVLVLWSVIGLAGIVVGHHTPLGAGPRSARAAARRSAAEEPLGSDEVADVPPSGPAPAPTHKAHHSHARHA